MMFRSKSKDKNDVMDINIPNRVVVRVMLVAVATLIGLAAVKQAGHALVLIFTAFFLSVALNAPVHWVAQRLPGKRKGSRAAATAISFLVVVALLVAFVVSIVPPLVDQTSNFIGRIPELSRQVHDKDSGIGRLVARYDLQDDINKFSSQLSDRLGNVSGAAVTGVQKFGSSVFALLTVLVLTFMMLIEGPRWKAFLMDLVPDERQARVERLTGDMYRVVKGYVNGQVVL